MTSGLLSLHERLGAATLALFLGSAALAQAPDLQPASPDRPRPRQPTPSSVQQQESVQATRDKSRAEADKKLREMESRLNRTLRSVCNGC